MGKKYIIELEDEAINDSKTLWKVKGFNALVFDQNGLNKLEPYKEPEETSSEEKAFPKNNDSYWYISCDGYIDRSSYSDIPLDRNRLAIGNCFKTEADALFAVERLKVINELKEFAAPFRPGEITCTICYAWGCHDLAFSCDINTPLQRHELYFASRPDAVKAVDSVGAERVKKYYFGVED